MTTHWSTEGPWPPGVKLRGTLAGQGGDLSRLAWSPDVLVLATLWADGTIGLWDAKTGLPRLLSGYRAQVVEVAWSADGGQMATASDDETIRVWCAATGELERTLSRLGSTSALAWSPDGRLLAAAHDDNMVRVWQTATWEVSRTFSRDTRRVTGMSWSPDGRTLAAGCDDGTVELWDAPAWELRRALRGHAAPVHGLAWAPGGQILASGSGDHTVRWWESEAGCWLGVLEGHADAVEAVAFSADGRLFASTSADNSVRLWRSDVREMVASLDGTPAPASRPCAPAFHPRAAALATLAPGGQGVHVWDVDVSALLAAAGPSETVHYTSAKVVLLGDTGVGKSGLALTLTGRPFAATASTHGCHDFAFDSMEVEHPGGRVEIRETLLRDLAGQPGYRLIHQISLDAAALALVVFDARSETDPFAGVRYWSRALRQAQRLRGAASPPLASFLVAARADRGRLSASPARVAAAVREFGFARAFDTSAKEGWQVAELRQAVRDAIDWDALPKVTSTRLFVRIVAFLTGAKKEGLLLTRLDDLCRAFAESPECDATPEQVFARFRSCISILESCGLVRQLAAEGCDPRRTGGTGDDFVLLQPELLDAYASALVNAVMGAPDGDGRVAENDALEGRFRMPRDERLADGSQERLLLRAAIQELLRHELAFREEGKDSQPWLVFPSQVTREPPKCLGTDSRTVSFVFEGPILSVYTTLAVSLARSHTFLRSEVWRNAVRYTAQEGETCGMILREISEGRGELTLFCDASAGRELHLRFEQFVFAHLRRHALPESVVRKRIFTCPNCGTEVADMQARRRRERGFPWLVCNVCGGRVSLLDQGQPVVADRPRLVDEIAPGPEIAHGQ